MKERREGLERLSLNSYRCKDMQIRLFFDFLFIGGVCLT